MEAGLPKAGAQGVWGQPELHETLPQILKRERKKSFDEAVSQYCVISFIKMPTLEQNMLLKMLARVKRRKVWIKLNTEEQWPSQGDLAQ